MHQAKGAFDVRVTPIVPTADEKGPTRMSITKQYHGPLEAQATGEMLSGGSPQSGTAGYVAMETVIGTLDAKQGSFQLMHWGIMHERKFHLQIKVVPGSGTDSLTGITGEMKIEISSSGAHSYELDYSLTE